MRNSRPTTVRSALLVGMLLATAFAGIAPALAEEGDEDAAAAAGAESAEPEPTSPVTPGAKPVPPPVEPVLSSVEQGQTPLSRALEWYKDREEIRAQRSRALRETHFEVLIRNFYFDRDRYDDSDAQAWALGGAIGLKTGYFREHLAVGATGYTSQRLVGDDDKDGSLLLKPGQHGFSVLGELYADLFFFDGLNLYAGRKRFETPYINSNDVRMIPNTFEAVTIQGVTPVGGRAKVNYGAGYFHKIKERDSDEFVTMSQDAGAEEDRGVFTVGGRFTLDEFTIGAIDYYSEDIINIAYAEAANTFPLPADHGLRLSVQYSDQRSTGSEYLDDEGFSAWQGGIKADLPLGPALLTAAFTHAEGSASMRSPWSGYPGYTSVQVEDFNRDGETAFMLRAGTALPWIPGLSTYALWVHGDPPDGAGEFRRDEADFNFQWAPPGGYLSGFSLRVRYAFVDQHDSSSETLHDVRVILNYNFGMDVKI